MDRELRKIQRAIYIDSQDNRMLWHYIRMLEMILGYPIPEPVVSGPTRLSRFAQDTLEEEAKTAARLSALQEEYDWWEAAVLAQMNATDTRYFYFDSNAAMEKKIADTKDDIYKSWKAEPSRKYVIYCENQGEESHLLIDHLRPSDARSDSIRVYSGRPKGLDPLAPSLSRILDYHTIPLPDGFTEGRRFKANRHDPTIWDLQYMVIFFKFLLEQE